jgi:hypothetical protein
LTIAIKLEGCMIFGNSADWDSEIETRVDISEKV